jgi:TolB-like protein
LSTFAPPRHSFAVLPFVNISGDKEQEYFSDGLTEELLNSLSRINELQVAARTSSFDFKGKELDLPTVAHSLNVASVLEGSVRRSGDRIRITAQLNNATTDFHLWSQTTTEIPAICATAADRDRNRSRGRAKSDVAQRIGGAVVNAAPIAELIFAGVRDKAATASDETHRRRMRHLGMGVQGTPCRRILGNLLQKRARPHGRALDCVARESAQGVLTRSWFATTNTLRVHQTCLSVCRHASGS